MALRRTSLSRLFLNQPDALETLHLQHLHTLHKDAGLRAFVFEDAPLRLLYLTPACLQSAMLIPEPARLVCAYSRLMMTSLLFKMQPKHILILGLGGGSLLKYCHRHLPECKISALDNNADVLRLAPSFYLPNDERVTLIHADAALWLPQQTRKFDLIFLDVYDKEGLVPALNTPEFYARCAQSLTSQGILVANIWGKPSKLASMLSHLRLRFAQQVFWARSPDSYNLIVFASKTKITLQTLIKRSHALHETHAELDLPQHCNSLQNLHVSADLDDQPALLASLRELLVADPAVPQNYADWRAHILATQ